MADRLAERTRRVGGRHNLSHEWDWRFITDGTQPCYRYPAKWWSDIASPRQAKRAKSLCQACPFILGCRLEGAKNKSAPLAGIWGGLFPDEIRRLRRNPEQMAALEAAVQPIRVNRSAYREGIPE